MKAGSPELSAKLVKPWPQWVNGKEAANDKNTVQELIPVLAGLSRDQDVELAAHAVGNLADRSECLSKAASEYFRLGRFDLAVTFDVEALRSAVASPTGEPKLQWRHDAALHNLALAHADRGDIQAALDIVAKIGDDAKQRDVTSYVIRRAIDSGHGPVVGPAIESLEQQAAAAQDLDLMLQATSAWYEVGNEDDTRRSLAQAMKMVQQPGEVLDARYLSTAAEWMWRLDGKAEASSMLAIVDKLGVNDPSAIDQLVELMKPISPAVAVQLVGRQTDIERQIDELGKIALQIAGDAK